MADANEKTQKASSATTKGDLGLSEVQAKVDKANAQGFYGTEADPTPNANYTLQGVVKGAPTPETDADARAKARSVTEASR